MKGTPRSSGFSEDQRFLTVTLAAAAGFALAISMPTRGHAAGSADVVGTPTPAAATSTPTPMPTAVAGTPTPTAAAEANAGREDAIRVLTTPGYVLLLSTLATFGLLTCWTVFWVVVYRRQENVTAVLLNPSFFRVVTVIGVIAATVVLSLCDKIAGTLTASILSGIVGYVLGSHTGKQPPADTAVEPLKKKENVAQDGEQPEPTIVNQDVAGTGKKTEDNAPDE